MFIFAQLVIIYFFSCGWVFAYMHVSLWCTCLVPVEAIKRLWLPCNCGCRQWVLSTQPSPLHLLSTFSQSFLNNMGPLTHCWLLKKEVTDSRNCLVYIPMLSNELFRYGVVCFDVWQHYVAEAGFELETLLSRPPICWEQKSMCHHTRPLYTS